MLSYLFIGVSIILILYCLYENRKQTKENPKVKLSTTRRKCGIIVDRKTPYYPILDYFHSRN